MDVRVGQTLSSTVDDTTVIVVRAPAGADLSVTCGGAEMSTTKRAAGSPTTVASGESEPTQIGKRYVDPTDALELLCTKPGTGRLAVDGTPLTIKAATALPASD